MLFRSEPGIYSAVIEAIASGCSRSNEIAMKTGEEQAKCLKYINTLCELDILYKETPFGEKDSSRKTLYGISDFMFRFWYRYVFSNRTLLETGAQEAVWLRRIEPDYSHYMGLVFERVCRDYLLRVNSGGGLPLLFTSIGRWWGNDPAEHRQVEIDLVAKDGKDYLFAECKWRSEALDLTVLKELRRRADLFCRERGRSYYYLFSRAGFTKAVLEEAGRDERVVLVSLRDLFAGVKAQV